METILAFSLIETDQSFTAKLANPPVDSSKDDEESRDALPQTLVRIPTEHAPVVQAQADAAEASIIENESSATS